MPYTPLRNLHFLAVLLSIAIDEFHLVGFAGGGGTVVVEGDFAPVLERLSRHANPCPENEHNQETERQKNTDGRGRVHLMWRAIF